jgi:ribosomal protein L16/L10AE
LDESIAREALRLAAHKLPIRTQFVGRRDIIASGGGEE